MTTVIWNGDFSTDDTSQWHGGEAQEGPVGSVSVGASVIPGQAFSAHFEQPAHGAGLGRIELDQGSSPPIAYGSTTVADHAWMIPTDCAFGAGGKFFAYQWHDFFDPCFTGGVQIRETKEMWLQFFGGVNSGVCDYPTQFTKILGTAVLGTPYYLRTEVRWHADPAVGYAKAWFRVADGPWLLVLPQAFMGTGSRVAGVGRNLRYRTGIYAPAPFSAGTAKLDTGGVIVYDAADAPPLPGGGGSNPANVSAPVLSGSAVQGSTLTCSTGTWTNSPSGYAYQWQRDNSGVGGYSDIGGATASTRVLDGSDLGCHIRCVVTASN